MTAVQHPRPQPARDTTPARPRAVRAGARGAGWSPRSRRSARHARRATNSAARRRCGPRRRHRMIATRPPASPPRPAAPRARPGVAHHPQRATPIEELPTSTVNAGALTPSGWSPCPACRCARRHDVGRQAGFALNQLTAPETEFMGMPLTEMMRSPACAPSCAAGEPALTSVRLSEAAGRDRADVQPRRGRSSGPCPRSRSRADDPVARRAASWPAAFRQPGGGIFWGRHAEHARAGRCRRGRAWA